MDYTAFHRALVDLHALFENSRFGHGNLLHYLAVPRTDVTTYDIAVMKRNFLHRKPADQHDKANCAPPDVGVFTKRANVLIGNPRAFALAVKDELSLDEIVEASYLDWSWSWLIAIKMLLMHRPDMAKNYRGLLPFGAPVVAYCNTLGCKNHTIMPSPGIDDHLWLRDLCNREADRQGISSVEVNNHFYILGSNL